MLKPAVFSLVALATAVSAGALAQGSPPAPAFRPSLGDLMIMTVQPRHLKLGLAGQEKNWALAAYQLHELEESFESVAHAWPKWQQVEIAETIKATMEAPLEAVERAIKASDAARFAETYARLTETCNACHQSANVGMIVIQVPKSSPFANQDFRPRKQ
ncbi:MAG: cytochrome c [Enhydrobacter sp.]|nr:cytochrome c [Enhydrobacter sp.]